MSDESNEDGLPFIPLSELRVLYQKAFLYLNIESPEGGFDEKDLWRLMVGLEVNARLANKWYEKAERLEAENAELKEAVAKAYNAIATIYLQDILQKVQKYVAATQADEDSGTDAES